MTKSVLEKALSGLKASSIFKDADETLLIKMLNEYSSAASFSKGETVFAESSSPALYLIIKGEARVNKGEAVISHLGEGDIFGGAFLYNQNYRFENTITALSTIKAVIIEKSGVDMIIAADGKTAINYIAYLSDRIGFLNGKIEGYTKSSAEEKLLLYLEKSCCGSDDKCEITVSMTELSDVLRISRASLYRVMDSLEKSGKISRDGKKIYLQTKSVERK